MMTKPETPAPKPYCMVDPLIESVLAEAIKATLAVRYANVVIGLLNLVVSVMIVVQLWLGANKITNSMIDNKMSVTAAVTTTAARLESNSQKLDELLKLLRNDK